MGTLQAVLPLSVGIASVKATRVIKILRVFDNALFTNPYFPVLLFFFEKETDRKQDGECFHFSHSPYKT